MTEIESESHQDQPTYINFYSICAIADSYENALTVDKILFNMVEDLPTAAVLSRLRYWFSPSHKDGQQRTRIYKDGRNWLARKDEDWLEEACVTYKQVRAIKKRLMNMGLVDVQIFKFNGETTTHWSLNIERFTELYNEEIQKKFAKCPNKPIQNALKGQSRLPYKDNPINKHIIQASYSSYLNSIYGEREALGASATHGGKKAAKDEFGHEVYYARLKGVAMTMFESLTFDQKQAFTLIMNVPPAKGTDKRANAIVALKTAQKYDLETIRKGISFYKQRVAQGFKPRNTGAVVIDFIEKGHEPLGKDAMKNYNFWEGNKYLFKENSYQEKNVYIFFPSIDGELHYGMSHEVFKKQMEKYLEKLRKYNGNIKLKED